MKYAGILFLADVPVLKRLGSYWDLPGGHIEPRSLQAAIREAQEVTAVDPHLVASNGRYATYLARCQPFG